MEEQTFEIWESQHFIGKYSKDFWKHNKYILTFWKVKYLNNTEKVINNTWIFISFSLEQEWLKLETARLYFPLILLWLHDNLFSYC